MFDKLQTLFWLYVLWAHFMVSAWDFAVTVKTKIAFFDEHWHEVTSSAHQFDQLTALAFDETEETEYFSDRMHNNGSIFSLKLPAQHDGPHLIEKVVQRTQNESITSIAYDPLNRNLFWADQHNRKIYFISIDRAENDVPKVLIDFINEDSLPDGIAIDICRRKLYWTNSNFNNASIERVDLDGSEREVIVKKDLYLPHGIVVDQLSDRIFWVDDEQGIHFKVESARLDGSDRQVIVKALDSTPSNLAVTKDLIFWTDHRHNAVWAYPKFPIKTNETEEHLAITDRAHKVLSFAEQPSSVIARTRFMTNLQNDQHCAGVVEKIKHRLLTPPPSETPEQVQELKMRRDYCLNDGELIAQSNVCICKIGYKGARCETSECHNFCVHGTCTMSSMGFPKCACQRGFYGERCQSYKCSGFCFNDGICKIERNGEPSCECRDNFGGQHCEQNSTEICALFCRLLKHESNLYVPFGCHDICKELAEDDENGGGQLYAIPTYQHLEVCQNKITWTSTLIIILVAGVVSCLCLVLLIVHGVRRVYKPARPRIRKTFVVRKQATASSDTPLTNRPIATQQCEITIENCCNMNICDTPCFDPNLVQKTLARDANSKEDKKMLIHNMEDDLY